MAIREDEHRLWCTHKREGVRIGGRLMRRPASVELFGAILGGDRNVSITHHITGAWPKCRTLNQALCSRTLNTKCALKSLQRSYGDALRKSEDKSWLQRHNRT